MGNYVLWGLNRVVGWDPLDAMRDAFARDGLFSRKHEIRLGDRNEFNERAAGGRHEESAPAELMHEGRMTSRQDRFPICNEYFVPIAVKCIGDPDGFVSRWSHQFRQGGLARLRQIRGRYAHYFDPEGGTSAPLHWSTFWKPQLGDAVGMHTAAAPDARPACLGLYELLRLERKPGERCILVGYSQGGLVAHYLAWLDEYLFEAKDRAIAGVVTVQAPNYGSPLARYKNEDNVAAGLFYAIASLGGLTTPAPFESLAGSIMGLAKGELGPPAVSSLDGLEPDAYRAHFDVQAVVALLEAAIADFRKLPEAQRKQRKKTLDFLFTARKWLTGLTTKWGSAFNDMNLEDLALPGTVLHGLATEPLQETLYGAVIGANYRVDDFVRSAFHGVWSLAVELFLPKIAERLRGAETAYRNVVMTEVEGLPPEALPRAQDYEQGVWVYSTARRGMRIEPRTHDFIIPTASQALGPRWRTGEAAPGCPPHFLGNALNEDAAHISGAARSDSGTSDEEFVVKLLKEMGKRLP